MAHADARANEHLARRVQEGAGAATAVSSATGGSSSSTSAASSSGGAPSQGEQGRQEVRAEP
eukprot:1650303-Alexandrium_andersonii.AAC.1